MTTMAIDIWIVMIGTAGVGAGLLVCAQLLASRTERVAKAWLGLTVLSLTLVMLGDVSHHANLGLPPGAFDAGLLAVGPGLWLYVRHLTDRARYRTRRDWFHLLPAAAVMLLVWSAPEPAPAAAERLPSLAASSEELVQMAVVAGHIAVYLALTAWAVWRWRRRLGDLFSRHDGRRLTGLALLVVSGLGLLGLWISTWKGQLPTANLASSIAVTAWTLALGVGGVLQAPLHAATAGPDPMPSEERAGQFDIEVEADPRTDALIHALESLMAGDKLYLEPDLALAHLCEALQATPHRVSHMLNAGMGLSFYDYVNGLRVLEVQRCLCDAAYAGQSILDIALASGFASKATFNAAFKKHTGTTPSAWRQQCRQAPVTSSTVA